MYLSSRSYDCKRNHYQADYHDGMVDIKVQQQCCFITTLLCCLSFVPGLARLRAVGGGVVGPADDNDNNLEDHGDHDDKYML